MVRICIRRNGSAMRSCQVVLLLLLASVLTQKVSAGRQWKQCFKDSTDVPKRYFLLEGDPQNINLEMSNKVTHQLFTHIYRILLEEMLGYVQVEIVKTNLTDIDSIVRRMSCYVDPSATLPPIVINVEVSVPYDYILPVGDCIDKVEPIAPAGRFGWYIPLTRITTIKHALENGNRILWTKFLDRKFTAVFDISEEFGSYLTKMVPSGNYSYNNYTISHGWYIPDNCQSHKSNCAVLLAPDFNETKEVIRHIHHTKMLVKVIWLGENLHRAYKHIMANMNNKEKSLVLLSWAPSLAVLDEQDFATVTMQRCYWNTFTSDDDCFYEYRRLEKFVYSDLEKFAPSAVDLLRNMNVMNDSYASLMQLYRDRSNEKQIEDIACDWLQLTNIKGKGWNLWIPDEEKIIHIGGIFPISGSSYTGKGIVAGAKLAVAHINRLKVLQGHSLGLLVSDGQCSANKVIKNFIDFITNPILSTMVGVLGPACSDTIEPIAGISKYYKMITISYSAEGAFFSDKDKYPYFFRTIGENHHYKHVYLQFLKEMGWKRVAALTEDGQKYTEYLSHMQHLLESKGITFIQNTKFPSVRGSDVMTSYLEDLKRKRARIIVADVFDGVARTVMCEAYKLGMTAKKGFVWFLPTWLNANWYNTTHFNKQFNETVNCTTSEMQEAINGYFMMTHAFWGEPNSTITLINQPSGDIRNELQSQNDTSSYMGYAYDTVLLYALALQKLMKKDTEVITSHLHSEAVTNNLTRIIKHLDFEGVSGRINMRGGNTRFSNIEIKQWQDKKIEVIGVFKPNVSDSRAEIIGGKLTLYHERIKWLGGKKPDDGTEAPEECTLNVIARYLDVECEMAIIIVNICAGLVIVGGVLLAFLLYKIKHDRQLKNTVQIVESFGLQHLLTHADYSGLDKWEIERESVVLNRKLGEGAFGTVYGGEANLTELGWTAVAVKTLKVGSSTEEKVDFLSEAEVMKRFEHKNIVKLLGVCTKVEPVYTVMEFMLYGDLKTYLLARRHLVSGNDDNEEVSPRKLTSMALDVARGLSYLAEMKYVHRDVASRNCLLNAQRVVKLGDFGMTRPVFENDYYKFSRRGMLPVRWMAPESLAMGIFTPASDVWSFGVLLYEIITFGNFPFQGLSNTQVLNFVKVGNTITVPRGVKPQLEMLLKTCWKLDANDRPSASELVEYMANNSRLIYPCLDVPISSVQMEDTGQLEINPLDRMPISNSSSNLKSNLSNGVSNVSITTPRRRRQSIQDSGVSMEIENCPKERLLPQRSDSMGNKHTNIQHISSDSGCGQEEHDGFFPSAKEHGNPDLLA